MNSRTLPLPRLTALTVAIGIFSGCPGKDEGEPTGTGTSAPSTGVEDSTSTSTGPDPTTGPGTAPATDSGTSTGEPDPVCECINPSGFGNLSFTCGSGACGLINLSCFSSDTDTGTGTDTDTGEWSDCEPEFDEAQIACALDLLIAGEPGSVLMWIYASDPSATVSGGFVQVFADRQGLTRTFSQHDLSGEDSAAGVVPLRAADYFQGCKDLPTVGARFACLKDWSEQEPAPQCDEPGHESGI